MSATVAERENRVAMSLKIRPSQRDFLDHAAAITGKNRSEFILESALQNAEDVVMDQRLFQLDAGRFAAFEQALNEPVDKAALNDLFSKKAPWD